MNAGAQWEDFGLVFCKETGHPMDPSAVSRYLWDALERCGLARMRVHDLRHTAATYLLTRGVNPKVVQELLGHSTVTLTLDVYSHVLPGMQEEAASRVDAALRAASRLA